MDCVLDGRGLEGTAPVEAGNATGVVGLLLDVAMLEVGEEADGIDFESLGELWETGTPAGVGVDAIFGEDCARDEGIELLPTIDAPTGTIVS